MCDNIDNTSTVELNSFIGQKKFIDVLRVSAAAAKMRKILAMYRENKDLIDVGMYQPGTNPKLDTAIEMMPKINAFLQQRTTDSVNMQNTIDTLVEMMSGVDI